MSPKNQNSPIPTKENGKPLQEVGGPEDVQDLAEEPRLAKAVEIAIQRASFSGPMPPPDILDRYNQIIPGAAKDILEEFKVNGAHSRDMEKAAIRGAIGNDKRGQWMAFVLVILGFVLIAYLAVNGHTAVAVVVAGTLLGAVITGFLSQRTRSKDKQETSDEE